MPQRDYQIFEIPDFTLQRGLTLPVAEVAYQTYGQLNADKSNVILYPTSYGAQHFDTEWLIGAGRVLDPTDWFIVIPNMFGNGLSSSPSTLPAPFGPDRPPLFTHWDNVHAQERLLREVFGVERIALAYGWSMGAQQSLHWGAIFPDRVDRICAICGTARTAPHNKLFLEGVRATLTGDPHWTGTHFSAHPVRGLRAMGRIYAGWAMSQTFYREELWRQAGYSSREDFILRAWEANFLRRDPHDLLASIETWLASDISDNPIHGGDLDRALGAITARTIMMPPATDLYFTPEDCRLHAAGMPNAEYRVMASDWGHRAGNPAQNPADEAILRKAVADLLYG
ncbi:Homoserine O-acetyltransferase [Roseivivax sp. THAF40]|uniref:alpha/beta fold hydrolase n=1 Tax=Roseivivax sp. THAF40 TaxID=2587858 RepID=UPI001268DBD0|nr:alpha/beta fold hydrolase [Roseivivax sp. THAF40]QFT45685.1 Homoserine O-acetyltransferase [Roseivivax sp. THAF40]